MNTYWGGSLAAAGGCLIFGALPRLKLSGRGRDAALLGLGFGVEWLTRPFESLLLAASVALLVAQALLPGGAGSSEQRTGRRNRPPHRGGRASPGSYCSPPFPRSGSPCCKTGK
jgi:hypothetical protein